MPSDETTVQEDPRAERAILLASEAYRLVQEAKDMREERDAAIARAVVLREALQRAGACLAGTYGYVQSIGDEGSAADVMVEIERIDAALARPVPEHASSLQARLTAADQMAEALQLSLGLMDAYLELTRPLIFEGLTTVDVSGWMCEALAVYRAATDAGT